MNIRTFQLIVPIVAMLYVLWQFIRIVQFKTKFKNVWPGIIFSISVALIAIFPDQITNWIAKTLDFESNINAIIFVSIGVLFILIIVLYDLYKQQQKIISKLLVKIAVLMAEKEESNS